MVVKSSGEVVVSTGEVYCSLVTCGVDFEAWLDNTDEIICSVVNSSVDVDLYDSLVDSNKVVTFSVRLCSVDEVDE